MVSSIKALVAVGASQGASTWNSYTPRAANAAGAALSQAKDTVVANPYTAVAVGGAIVLIPATGLVTTPFLAATGFSPAGVQAGSMAAVVHSGIGNIATGSTFAMMQSAGMGGAGAVVFNGAVLASAALAGIGAGVAGLKPRL